MKQLTDARAWHDNFFNEEEAWVSVLNAASPTVKKAKKAKKAAMNADPELEDDDDTVLETAKGLPFDTPLAYASGWPKTRDNYVHLLDDSVKEDLRIIQSALDVPPSWDNPQTQLLGALRTRPGFSEDFIDMWKTLPTMEKEVRDLRDVTPAEERRSVFVRHSGDAPVQDQHYDPKYDAAREHIAIVQVEADESTFGRGWELCRIDSDKRTVSGIQVVDVTYLAPKKIKKLATQWPAAWPKYLMVPMYVKEGRRRVEYRQDNFPVEAIVWSTEQKRFNATQSLELRIPVAVRKYALLAASRCSEDVVVYLPMPQLGAGIDADD